MRLIDADNFGNRMYHEAFEKDSVMQKWDSGCWIRYKLFEIVLREQPTVTPEPHWIPVAERLPVEGESVLLCNSYGDMTLGRLVRTNEGCNWDIYAWWCDIYDWVAWMPLPEPWKGDAK